MFYANDEPEGKFLYTKTIKLYCTHVTVRRRLRKGVEAGPGVGGGGGEEGVVEGGGW